MPYLLRCDCGRQLIVTEGVPGLTVTCGCGERCIYPMLPKASATTSLCRTRNRWSILRTLFQLTPRCFVTPAIFWLNIIVFVAMVLTGVNLMDPTSADLIQSGANYGPKTLSGEYWRLLTCTFLHIGVIHLACNMWALWNVGFLVERLVGNVAFLVLYLVSGLLGSIASLYWNPDVPSPGASGAIFGVLEPCSASSFSDAIPCPNRSSTDCVPAPRPSSSTMSFSRC